MKQKYRLGSSSFLLPSNILSQHGLTLPRQNLCLSLSKYVCVCACVCDGTLHHSLLCSRVFLAPFPLLLHHSTGLPLCTTRAHTHTHNFLCAQSTIVRCAVKQHCTCFNPYLPNKHTHACIHILQESVSSEPTPLAVLFQCHPFVVTYLYTANSNALKQPLLSLPHIHTHTRPTVIHVSLVVEAVNIQI